MFLLCALASWVSVSTAVVGPTLDPIAGESIHAVDRDLLPSGQHTGSIADLWFVNVMSLQQNGGGIALFDPLRLSSHGLGFAEMRFFVNGMDVTDPARPGRPLLEIPHHAWHRLHHTSLWSSAPGFSWELTPASATVLHACAGSGETSVWLGEARQGDTSALEREGATKPEASGSDETRPPAAGCGPRGTALYGGGQLGQHIDGGGTWIPAGLMDREPATRAGAPSERRRLDAARGVYVDGAVSREGGAPVDLRVHAEHLEHLHRYPTLKRVAGTSILDDASRTTALAVMGTSVLGTPLHVLAAWQGLSRSHAGAELRLPGALTRDSEGSAFMAQARTQGNVGARSQWSAGVGVGFRSDDDRLNGDGPVMTDLEDQWMWLGRPELGAALSRGRVDARADLHLAGMDAAGSSGGGDDGARPLRLGVRFSYGWLQQRPRIPTGRAGVTYLRSAAALPGGGRAHSQAVYDDAVGHAQQRLQSGRLDSDYERSVGPVLLRLHGALDYAAVGGPEGLWLSHWAPALGVAASWSLGRGHTLFGLARREPVALTYEASSFLDPQTPTGIVYRWDDTDGDNVPEAGEEGAVLRRFGGAYHTAARGVRRPSGNQLCLGWKHDRLGPFRAVFAGVARFLVDRYTVRLGDESSYDAVMRHDPGGDGRGELRGSDGGGQPIRAYARDSGAAGEETYVLTNARRADFYLGLEAQLALVQPTWWFFNLGGVAYLSQGSAPLGSFPDRNDPSVIDEASADPNQRVNQRGRYDHDRAFGINLMAGVLPSEDLAAALVLRYRDGQPFTRVLVVDDLPQGPTAVMAVTRGAPRHTFHMTLDVRVRYTLRGCLTQGAVVLDAFNLLGSGTEILEDPRTGRSFRSPLEMVPGRGVLLSLEMGTI